MQENEIKLPSEVNMLQVNSQMGKDLIVLFFFKKNFDKYYVINLKGSKTMLILLRERKDKIQG